MEGFELVQQAGKLKWSSQKSIAIGRRMVETVSLVCKTFLCWSMTTIAHVSGPIDCMELWHSHVQGVWDVLGMGMLRRSTGQ